MPVRLQAERRKMKFATRALTSRRRGGCVAGLGLWLGWKHGGSGSGGPSGTHAPATSTTSAGGGVMTHCLLPSPCSRPGRARQRQLLGEVPPPPVRWCSSWFAASPVLPRSPSRWAASTSTWWSVSSLPSTTSPGTYAIPFTASLEAVDLGSHQFGMTGAKLKVNADGSG